MASISLRRTAEISRAQVGILQVAYFIGLTHEIAQFWAHLDRFVV